MSDLLTERSTEAPGAAGIPARLCWEAAQLCRAMDLAAEQLQHALNAAAEHANAVIEIALLLDRACPARDARPDSATPANH